MDVRQELKQLNICVIVPTYNNRGTVLQVLDRLRPFASDILVVNDGSTDDTLTLLRNYQDKWRTRPAGSDDEILPATLHIETYETNQGKGHALRCGFRRALELGFDYAITIDSDGQHYPEDLPLFAEQLKSCLLKGEKEVLIVGNRKLHQENMPGGNTFANYFSNFWFLLQTWQYLPDTQTGYRLYPLHHLHGLSLLTARYEAELELLVLSAWHGVKLVSVPIRVYYPPQGERVTHFRPFWDFARIFVLNTVLCVLCVLYGWWMLLWHRVIRSKRTATVYAFTIFLLCAVFGAIPMALFYRLVWPHDEKRKLQFHQWLCNFFRWSATHIPGVTIRLNNTEGEDFSKPAIIICNHQSHLDLLCTLMLSPRIVAMTNQWAWNFPLYVPVIRYLEFYPAADGLEMCEQKITSLLERGYSVLIFPEGTRSATCEVLRFHRGAFYLAQRTGADLLPIYLDGPGRVLPKTDFTLYSGQITVEVGKRSSVGDTTMGETYQQQTRAWRKQYEQKIASMRSY